MSDSEPLFDRRNAVIVALVSAAGVAAWAVGGDVRFGGLFVLGMVALLVGGFWLVEGAVTVARWLGLSTLLIGLTIVAFGTSAPELAFNVMAARDGHGALSFGNVVGSNIANIGLVLGLAAIVRPIDVKSRIITTELPWLLGATALMVLAAWVPPKVEINGVKSFGFMAYQGGGMLLLFGAMTWQWYMTGRREMRDPLAREAAEGIEEDAPGRPIWLGMLLVVIGLAMLLLGGQLSKSGAVGIATALGLSQALVGLTIVAIATSLPEVATTIAACLKGHPDLAVGNVIGSNLFNILLVMGVTSVVSPVPVPAPYGWWDLGMMMFVTALLIPITVGKAHRITRVEGLVLLVLYVAYMAFGVVRETLS